MNELQYCSRCIMDTTVNDVWFDEKGVCKYCYIHDEMEKIHPLDSNEHNRLNLIVSKIKKSGEGKKYDCICGLSGGRDSSYTLLLAKKMGLKPLAVTLDNGWGTSIAEQNINNACKILDIDLITVKVDWEEHKDIQRAFLIAGISDVDLPSDLGIYALLYSSAKKYGLKHILNGHSFRTEGTSPISWSYFDPIYFKDVYKKFGSGKKIKTLPFMSMWQLFKYTFFDGIREIRILEYLDYKKSEVDAILEKELNWKYYGGHHHENIFTKFAISYWLYEKFNIDKRIISLSAQVLSGAIEKNSAIEELKRKPYEQAKIEKDIEYILKKLDLSKSDFDKYFFSENHFYADYPSYYPILSKFIKYSGPVLKMVLPYKPMTLFQIEMRDN